MRIGGRPLGHVLRAPLSRGHWKAVATMPQVYPRSELRDVFGRFLLDRGQWPWSCHVRTPVGVVQVHLDRRDDLLTVNEVFARGDYAAPTSLRVAVDVGSNVGLASLYFLTRNATSRTYCIEPDPKNLARLRQTLAPYEGRWSVQEVAAAEQDGTATFFVEETGRYGGFEQGWKSESITVPTRSFTTMLDEVLEREARIDVLKVDTEGSEEALVSSIRPDQLDRIDRIYYETDDPQPFHLDRFHHHFDCQTNALVARSLG